MPIDRIQRIKEIIEFRISALFIASFSLPVSSNFLDLYLLIREIKITCNTTSMTKETTSRKKCIMKIDQTNTVLSENLLRS